MVFKSDKQRKKVMALLRGGTHAAVSPQIIREANVLKPGLARQEFIRDRKSGLTISQSLKKLTDKAIRKAKSQRERKTTKLVKRLIKKNPKLKTIFKKQRKVIPQTRDDFNIEFDEDFQTFSVFNQSRGGITELRDFKTELEAEQAIDDKFDIGERIKQMKQ